MKYCLYFIAMLMLAGCSSTKRAHWHLDRALQLEPNIISYDRDTSYIEKITARDSTFFFNREIVVNLSSDTAYFAQLIEPYSQFDTIIKSDDGIAMALLSFDNGNFSAQVWAVYDSTQIYKDSIELLWDEVNKTKIVTDKPVIEKKITFSFFDYAIAFLILIFLAIIIILIIKRSQLPHQKNA
jgi:hypothetical protein